MKPTPHITVRNVDCHLLLYVFPLGHMSWWPKIRKNNVLSVPNSSTPFLRWGFLSPISSGQSVLQFVTFTYKSPCFQCGLLTQRSVWADVAHIVNPAGFIHQLWHLSPWLKEHQVWIYFCFVLLQWEGTDKFIIKKHWEKQTWHPQGKKDLLY